MNDVVYFDKTLYKGNINRDFYWFCCRQNKKLLRYVFSHIFFYLGSFFSKKMALKRVENYHCYLKKVPNYAKLIKEFKKRKAPKMSDRYLFKYLSNNINIIAKCPIELVQAFLGKQKIIAYELDKNFQCQTAAWEKRVKELKNIDSVYTGELKDLFKVNSLRTYYCKGPFVIIFRNRKRGLLVYNLLKWGLFGLLGFFLLLISFTFTTVYLDTQMITSYLHSGLLLFLNYLPILICLVIILLLTKKVWVSFSVTSLLIIIMGIVNKTKLYYRDDVFKFEDLTLIKEAAIMTTRYQIIVRWYTVVCLICCLILTVFLKRYWPKLKIKLKSQLIALATLFVLIIFLLPHIYFNSSLYDKVGDKSFVNNFISTRMSQIKGLIYPFIYSITEFKDVKPEGYNEQEAAAILAKYQDDAIPDEKKVNFIGIMLEAYNDFSKFPSITFKEDIYKPMHEIRDKSLHGNIIVDIFGGGTVMTERYFITGLKNLPSFRKPVNSYAWYFKENGYVTEAMHPLFGSFYNRNTSNYNLGFDNYWNYENKYSLIQEEYMMDMPFYQYLKENLVATNQAGQKYFNFSVTYQNHGPYETKYLGHDLIKNKDYSPEAYNMVNNYFNGIKEANLALADLVDFLDNYAEPTVLVFFGDHNPYLGEENYGYEELGIDMDITDTKTFENYYSIPYVIYANPAAKKVLNKDFLGEMPTISPYFLMSEIFEYMGYKGNAYTKFLQDVKQKVSVISSIYNREDDKYVKREKSKYNDLIAEFDKVNYYYQNKKIKSGS